MNSPIMADKNIILCLTSAVASNRSDDTDSTSWSDLSSIESMSCEDEDEDDRLFFPLMNYLIRLRRKRVDDYLHIVESWSESEFKNRLSLSRKTAHWLIDELDKSGFIATHKFGIKPLEPRLCFYIFLSFIASTEPLTPIAARFDISLSSTFRVIRRVVSWILTKLNKVIKWPVGYTKVSTVCEAFHSKTGISNVLGVIDCTHIKIEKPKNTSGYCNSKGYYSLILQATVDSNLGFTNIYCGEPGSINSSRVCQRSPLFSIASQNKDALFPHDTFLVGHSGYPSLPWLVTPFRENSTLTIDQREFNAFHSSARKFGNKAFNLLKNRFKRIKYFTVYRNIAFITDTVVAACILHNCCVFDVDSLN